MTTTLLITLAQPDPEQIETFHDYVTGSTELALAAGGGVSSRFGVRQILGDSPAVIFGLATFPDPNTITDMFSSDAYQELVPLREESIVAVNAYIAADAAVSALADPAGVYLVTTAAPNPEAMEELATYQKAAGPLSAEHGAEPIANLEVSGHPVGETPAGFVAVARFPSADAVEAFLADPRYEPLIDLRDRALRSLNLYVTTD